MRFANWVVANSHAGVMAFGMEKRNNVSVINNGVGLERFSGIDPARLSDPAICMVGNFTRKKDQGSLISIMPELRKKFPKLQLVLVGRGEKQSYLQQIVDSLGLQDNVIFVTDCNNPESLIKASRVGLLLSPEGEGLSNVIIEYMALGKPVIASSLGGNCELVDHGTTGFLVNNGNHEKLIDYITRLLSNSVLAQNMGMAGKSKISRDFTITKMVSQYEALYSSLINRTT